MPRTCYSGKTPITCTSRHAVGTFWMSELSQTSRSPCSRYPKTGKVCWTYLSHVGLSDGGGGVQDQAGQEQMRQRVIHQLQASNQLTYKGISLDDIKKVPTTEQLTTALLNSSYNLWRNCSKTGDSNCWICFPFSTLSNIVGIPLPTNWTLPNSTITNQTIHIGPIGGNIPIINSSNSLTPTAANITNSSLPYCAPSGIFLSCPQGTYRCLTANDSLDCTFILLSPSTNIYSDSQLQSTLFLQYRRKRAAFLPFLIGAGITTGVATGVAGMGTSIDFYYKLSQALNDDMERIADSLTALQTQVTSLAAVTLQNRRALDLLTAKKGGTCLYLNEECCYFVNQSGIVTSKVKELRDRIQTRRQGSSFWGLDPHTWERLQELTRVSVNQLLLHPYSRLPTSDYPYNDAPPSAGSSQSRVDAPDTII
nr:syncytin-1-like [Vulpes vulpes]